MLFVMFVFAFGERLEITAGTHSYLGASGTIEVDTHAIDGRYGEDVGELVMRCVIDIDWCHEREAIRFLTVDKYG